MTAVMVSPAYCGDMQFRASSLRQTSHPAMKPPPSVITLTRDIANLEDPIFCFKNVRLDRKGARTVEELTATADCQPF